MTRVIGKSASYFECPECRNVVGKVANKPNK